MLAQQIQRQIQEKGRITFADFVGMASFDPTLGYYMREHAIFGREGDFITSPEVSSLFGASIALFLAPILQANPHYSILEFGAGSGKLAKDILSALEKENQLPKHYFICDISPSLRLRQQQALSSYQSMTEWVAQVPKDFEGIILGNEVLDAFPVHRFELQTEKAFELYVNLNDKQEFIFERGDFSSLALAKEVEKIREFLPDVVDSYQSEINLNSATWLEKIKTNMKAGIVLLIDYGYPRSEYYHPDRNTGTLVCHYRHQRESNPFIHIGEQDITAHVDFSFVAEQALAQGFSVEGFTSQAAFLLGTGITELLAKINNQTDYLREAQKVKFLTSPNEMGELFKVMLLSKACDENFPAFSLFDLRYRL